MREFNKIRVSKTPQKARDFLWLKNTEEGTYKLMMPTGSAFIEIPFASIANIQFMGIAHPSTNPGTPEFPQFYIAYEEGEYDGFSLSLEDNAVAIFLSNIDKGWDLIYIKEAPYSITITYDALKGTLEVPYTVDGDLFGNIYDGFISGKTIMIGFQDTYQTYYATVNAVSKAYIICTFVDGDDAIKTVYICEEVI